jgi:predicted patatin/cPLA2 family phospholipase
MLGVKFRAVLSRRILADAFNGKPMSAVVTRLVLLLLLPTLAGCAAVARVPYSRAVHNDASVAGFADARIWADDAARWKRLFDPSLAAARPLTVLALSGGGAEGAYGAGFLNGWSASGTRPEFSIVTGTSVGALMGPFAFLGPSYDARLKELFTSGEMSNLLRIDGLNGVLGSSIYNNGPLKDLIARYADEALLDAIAIEHRKGRRLFVSTTNMDAQRSVIWNMSGIAASGHPDRLKLFRSILLASSSVPGIYPPVLIDVVADGASFAEMHVDGGVTANVLTVPEAALLSSVPVKKGSRPQLFVIVNGKLGPDFDVTEGSTLSVLSRSMWTTVKANMRNTLIATYDFTRRNNWEFRATAIDIEHPIATTTINFDANYLRGLYDYGITRGQSGTAWHRTVASFGVLGH